jgi:hypothetical protein
LFNSASPFRLKLSEAANYQEMPDAYKKFVEANPMLQKSSVFSNGFFK